MVNSEKNTEQPKRRQHDRPLMKKAEQFITASYRELGSLNSKKTQPDAMSPATTHIFHRSYDNTTMLPNFFDQDRPYEPQRGEGQ